MMNQEIYMLGLYVNNTEKTHRFLQRSLRLYHTNAAARELWTKVAFADTLAHSLQRVIKDVNGNNIDVDIECTATIQNLRVLAVNEFNKFEL